jgi:hypothetical protein
VGSIVDLHRAVLPLILAAVHGIRHAAFPLPLMVRTLVLALIVAATSLAQPPTVGVVVNTPQAFDGYTLLIPEGVKGTYLIDNCGRLVRSWISIYNTGMVARLIPGGRLLRTAKVPSTFNIGGSGGGIEIYDWNGALRSSYRYVGAEYCQHHDAIMMPNGHILTLAWEVHSISDEARIGRDTTLFPDSEVWSERIVELEPVDSATANVVWIWKAWDHVVQDHDPAATNYGSVADHPELLDINYPGQQGVEIYHLNAVDYNAVLDQVMVCSPFTNEIYVIDHSTTTQEAASHTGGTKGQGGDILYRWGNPRVYGRGSASERKFFGQHDAQWIKPGLRNAGKIMVFNNGAGRPDGEYTSIEVIDPPVTPDGHYSLSGANAFGPDSSMWTFSATPPSSFFAKGTGGAHTLPNGNILACQSVKARIIEIDTTGAIVWDYHSPIASGGMLQQGTPLMGVPMFRSYRYAADSPELRGMDLTPGGHLEINPILSACDSVNGVNNTPPEMPGMAVTNPFYDRLVISSHWFPSAQIVVTDITGRVVIAMPSTSSQTTINTSSWPAGAYCIRIPGEQKPVVALKID